MKPYILQGGGKSLFSTQLKLSHSQHSLSFSWSLAHLFFLTHYVVLLLPIYSQRCATSWKRYNSFQQLMPLWL